MSLINVDNVFPFFKRLFADKATDAERNTVVTKMNDVTLIYIDEALTFLCYEKDLNLQSKVQANANSSRRK